MLAQLIVLSFHAVDQLPVLLFDQKKGKLNFPPVLNGPIDTSDFQSVIGIPYLKFLPTASTLEQIPRSLLSCTLLVVHPDLRLVESRCVIEPIGSFWDLLLHQSIIIFVLTINIRTSLFLFPTILI